MPNPSLGIFTLNFESNSRRDIIVYDVNQRLVSSIGDAERFRKEMDLTNLLPGIYFIKVIEGQENETPKIIIY